MTISGVMPSASGVFGSAPAFRSFSRTAVLPTVDGFGHRRRAEFVLCVDVGAGSNQPIDHIGVGIMDGPVECRCAVGGRAVHVHLLVDQLDRGASYCRFERRRSNLPAPPPKRSPQAIARTRAIDRALRILDLRERLRAVIADFLRFDSRSLNNGKQKVR